MHTQIHMNMFVWHANGMGCTRPDREVCWRDAPTRMHIKDNPSTHSLHGRLYHISNVCTHAHIWKRKFSTRTGYTRPCREVCSRAAPKTKWTEKGDVVNAHHTTTALSCMHTHAHIGIRELARERDIRGWVVRLVHEPRLHKMNR